MSNTNYDDIINLGGNAIDALKNYTHFGIDKTIPKVYLIYNIEDRTKLNKIEIPVIPESISYSHTPNFSEQDILGRLTPIMTYTNNSDEIYSFSIRLHEDLVNTENKEATIVEFVDKLKMFSYPIQDNNVTGITNFPMSYFQIGEIAGYGIITVSVNWNKPFRKGRYVLVDLNFNIVVEHLYSKPTMTTRTEEVLGLDGVTYYENVFIQEDYMLSSSNFSVELYKKFQTEQNRKLAGYGENTVYNVMVGINDSAYANNLLRFTDGKIVTDFKQTVASEKFVYQYNELVRMYGVVALFAPNIKADTALAKKLTNGVLDLNKPFTPVSPAETLKTIEQWNIKASSAKKAFAKYIEDYYDATKYDDLPMLQKDKAAIINKFNTIIDNMVALQREVVGYGANS